MNWDLLENTWERVKDGAESAWDRVSGGLGHTTEAAEEKAAEARRALETWRPERFHRGKSGWALSLDALLGAAAGAGLMYMFDPQRGRRRRALVRDQAISALTTLDDAIGVLSRDLRNRSQGVWAETRSLAGRLGDESTSDETLVARARSRLGHVVSSPRAIEVDASDGRIALSGQVLAHERDGLLRAIAAVPGVNQVDDNLEVYDSPQDAPALQGGRPRFERVAMMRENWSPTARLLIGAAGGLMLIGGAERGGPSGWILGGLGAGMIARASTNIPIRDWAGTSGRETADRGRRQTPEPSEPRRPKEESELDHAVG